MSLAESRWPNQVYVALWSVNEASGDGGYVLIQFILYMHVHVCVCLHVSLPFISY